MILLFLRHSMVTLFFILQNYFSPTSPFAGLDLYLLVCFVFQNLNCLPVAPGHLGSCHPSCGTCFSRAFVKLLFYQYLRPSSHPATPPLLSTYCFFLNKAPLGWWKALHKLKLFFCSLHSWKSNISNVGDINHSDLTNGLWLWVWCFTALQ